MRTLGDKLSIARKVGTAALDWLYPSRCCLCGLLGPSAICDTCRSEFVPADSDYEVFAPDSPLAFRATLFRYEGRAAQAVRRLKFNRSTALAEPMARILAEGIASLGLGGADAYIPVPIHWTRRFQRGFNQSELLCRSLERARVQSGWLVRTRATRPQVGLTQEERLRNLNGAFWASPEVDDLEILLVDDVATSGGTALECARALRGAGAKRVGIITFVSG